MTQDQAKIMMVYNADSGMFNAVTDSVHKIISPESYKCSLCSVTFGMVSMRHHWRQFLGGLPMKKEFYHRDEFVKSFPATVVAPPAIMYAAPDAEPKVLVGKDELASIDDLSQLIALTEQRLANV